MRYNVIGFFEYSCRRTIHTTNLIFIREYAMLNLCNIYRLHDNPIILPSIERGEENEFLNNFQLC